MNPMEDRQPGTAHRFELASPVVSKAEDPLVLQAVEEYLAEQQLGRPPDRQEFLARHSDIAPALAECLDGLEFIQAVAPRLQESAVELAVADAASLDTLRAEGLLGDYRIVREVGRGGMGVVYEAVQVSLGRRVALKVLPFAAALDARQLQRFQNEAHAAAQLHHTNIVPVYAVGCERGVHFYAMQFIEGQTLAVLIRDLRQLAGLEVVAAPVSAGAGGSLASDLASGRFAPVRHRPAETATPAAAALSTEGSVRSPALFRTVANLGVQAAEALEHAHQLGVIHRDIKPANLLVDLRGNLWVTDFGLAQFHRDAGLTLSGDLLGTVRYMSPEQALGQRELMDHRTDLYSLGATLYELLALAPAFGGSDRQQVLRQIAVEEPRPPRRLNRAVPAELETIVLKAMAKESAERYATAQELADDLRRFLEDKPIRARRPTLRQRLARWSRRYKAVVRSAAVSTVVLALGLGVVVLLLWDKQQQTEAALQQAETQRQEAERRRLIAERNFQRACVLLNKAPIKHQLGWLAHKGRRNPAWQETQEKALAFFQGLLAEPGSDPGDRLLTAQVHIELADIYDSLERRAEAVQEYEKAIVLLRPLVAEFPQEAGFRDSLACCFERTGSHRGWLYRDLAAIAEQEEDFRQAISLYEGLREEFRDVPWYRLRLADCWSYLGEMRRRIGRFQQAEEAHRRALALHQPLFDEFPQVAEERQLLARSHNNLAWVLTIRPDRQPHHAAEALEHAQKAVELAPGHHDWWHTLGVAQCRMGHWKETLAAIEKSRQLEGASGPPDSWDRFFEAMAHSGLGDREKARRCYDEGVHWMEQHAPEHPDLRRFRAEAASRLGLQEPRMPPGQETPAPKN